MHNVIECPDFEHTPHGFFSRKGGVSTGLYKGLNCGPGSDDTLANVLENRRRVACHISGRATTPLLSLYQIHSAKTVTATSDWGENRPQADAVVSNTPGLILGILTADCTPVLFIDQQAGVIGAAHAGWKGALSGVLENTVTSMEALGAKRSAIKAAIGPTIHMASYEVHADFEKVFLQKDSAFSRFFIEGTDEEHRQFDLPGFVHFQLERINVGQIWDAEADTYRDEAYFSYRRTTHRQEPDYGRQISTIMLPA